MTDLKNKIIKKLREVVDPQTTLDVISMGLIKDLQVAPEGKVSFTFRPSSPICPLVFSLVLNVQKVVKNMNEVKDLRITVIDHQGAGELNDLLKD